MSRVYKRSGSGMSVCIEHIGAVLCRIISYAVLHSLKTRVFPMVFLVAYGFESYIPFYKLWTWSVKFTLFGT